MEFCFFFSVDFERVSERIHSYPFMFCTCLQADIDLAVAAAKEAFKRGSVYRNLDVSARGKLLWKYVKVNCFK